MSSPARKNKQYAPGITVCAHTFIHTQVHINEECGIFRQLAKAFTVR